MDGKRQRRARRTLLSPPPHHEWMEGGMRQEHYGEMVHSCYDEEIDTYSGIRLGIMGSSFTIEQKLYCVLLTEKKNAQPKS